MPETSSKINEQLNIELVGWDSIASFDGTKAGIKVHKGENIFPRIDVQKKIEELNKIKEEQIKSEGQSQQEVKSLLHLLKMK